MVKLALLLQIENRQLLRDILERLDAYEGHRKRAAKQAREAAWEMATKENTNVMTADVSPAAMPSISVPNETVPQSWPLGL